MALRSWAPRRVVPGPRRRRAGAIRLPVVVGVVAAASLAWVLGCAHRSKTGAFEPPPDAPAWTQDYARAFDDGYTRETVRLEGRAPNDVLDQRLFSERLGESHIVATVTVGQVWARGRYEGRQQQYLEVSLDDVLMGELPLNTDEEQLLQIIGTEDLPGTLAGQRMILFVRWAPELDPPYRHHLMPADDEVVAFIQAMVEHAKQAGILDADAHIRKRPKRRRRKSAAERAVSAEDEDEELP